MPHTEPNQPTRVWITGAGGLIGSHIAQAGTAVPANFKIRPLTRAQLDLCDFNAVTDAYKAEGPNLIIHCAALTKSPDCQTNPSLAWRINFEATRHLASVAAEAQFVFFSTDLVFDGKKGNYSETDPVNPLSVYGETKAAAEQVVLSNPRHTVIRTTLTVGTSPTGDRSLDEQLRHAWERSEIPRLFTDEFRSPIAAEATAPAVWELVARRASGLFHLAGSERLSRWEIGRIFQARWPELNPRIEAASLQEYRGAPRAPDTSLDSRKVQGLLSFRLPGLREHLAKTRATSPALRAM